MLISIRAVPGMATISPTNVAERSLAASDVRHCSSVAEASAFGTEVELWRLRAIAAAGSTLAP